MQRAAARKAMSLQEELEKLRSELEEAKESASDSEDERTKEERGRGGGRKEAEGLVEELRILKAALAVQTREAGGRGGETMNKAGKEIRSRLAPEDVSDDSESSGGEEMRQALIVWGSGAPHKAASPLARPRQGSGAPQKAASPLARPRQGAGAAPRRGFVACVACGKPLGAGSSICSCGEHVFDKPLATPQPAPAAKKMAEKVDSGRPAPGTADDALSEADAFLNAFAPPRRGGGGAGGIPQIRAGGLGGQSLGPTPRMEGGYAGGKSLGPTPRMEGGFTTGGKGGFHGRDPTPRMDGVVAGLGPTPRMDGGFAGLGPTPRMDGGFARMGPTLRKASQWVDDSMDSVSQKGEWGGDGGDAEGTPRMGVAVHVARQRIQVRGLVSGVPTRVEERLTKAANQGKSQ